ncbi:MAG: nucleoside-diphosphate kinase [Candidatus Nanoarchaeia archaeon]|nr:nucleoside-diphosphate kinase [Candidatus Nanoarchaeia archaeon]
MIEHCLVLIKPDSIMKSITGDIISSLSTTGLEIIGMKVISVSDKLAREHYKELELKKPQVFEETIKYITGQFHIKKVIAIIYSGENAIEKIRTITGPTNPEEADPTTIRGKYGRINSKLNIMENVVHASDSSENAEKEIKLWFKPTEIIREIYPIKEIEELTKIFMWD